MLAGAMQRPVHFVGPPTPVWGSNACRPCPIYNWVTANYDEVLAKAEPFTEE